MQGTCGLTIGVFLTAIAGWFTYLVWFEPEQYIKMERVRRERGGSGLSEDDAPAMIARLKPVYAILFLAMLGLTLFLAVRIFGG
jgi:hypothetical protein